MKRRHSGTAAAAAAHTAAPRGGGRSYLLASSCAGCWLAGWLAININNDRQYLVDARACRAAACLPAWILGAGIPAARA
jgi:hypothetical protein